MKIIEVKLKYDAIPKKAFLLVEQKTALEKDERLGIACLIPKDSSEIPSIIVVNVCSELATESNFSWCNLSILELKEFIKNVGQIDVNDLIPEYKEYLRLKEKYESV